MFLFFGYSLHYLARQYKLSNVTKLSRKETKERVIGWIKITIFSMNNMFTKIVELIDNP